MWACIQKGVVVGVKLQSRLTQCCSVTTDISKNIFLISFFAPQCKQTLYYTGPLNPPLWHLHMAGKCFVFAPICLHCCIANLAACSDIWVWPFCAACANQWNKSIDIKIIKPFTFYCNSDFFFLSSYALTVKFFVPLQNEREQIMTTNLWLFQVC